MSRVITFSRFFPAYHPRKGEETFFVEKIWNSFREKDYSLPQSFSQHIIDYCKYMPSIRYFKSLDIREVKEHTIRAGNRWKVGDKFSPRVWSGKPYASKQIVIAPDVEIKKIWGFVCTGTYFYLNDRQVDVTSTDIPTNDGLSSDDFLNWFPECNSFEGQIICWDENINY